MAKSKKEMNDALGNLKDFMKTKEDTTPIQTTVVEDKKAQKEIRIEETKFTVHIPTDLLDSIKEIAFYRKAKIKNIMVEALQDYVTKNK